MTLGQISSELDPAMQFVLRSIRERDPDDLSRTWWRVEAGAGLGKDTLRRWLYRREPVHGPPIAMVRAALRELGYDLAVVPLERDQAGIAA